MIDDFELEPPFDPMTDVAEPSDLRMTPEDRLGYFAPEHLDVGDDEDGEEEDIYAYRIPWNEVFAMRENTSENQYKATCIKEILKI